MNTQAEVKSLGLFETIGYLIKMIPWLRQLMPLPDWNVSQQVREWAKSLVGLLNEFAKTTETKVDDAAIAMVSSMIDSDSMWDMFWSLVHSQVAAQELGVVASSEEQKIASLADESGIPIGTIAALVSAIVAVIGLFKKKD